MKRKLCFFICVVFTLIVCKTHAQYYVKTNTDSVPLSIDSTILTLGAYHGELVWQASSDSVNWTNLKSPGDSLVIRIDSTAVYRGSISEENCETIFSDTILVGEEIIHPNAYYFWAYSKGGVYYLPDGIKVKIPPGAIKDSLYMLVEPIDSITSYSVFPALIDNGRIFLGALNVLPHDAIFEKPIKIQFSVSEFNYDDKLVLSGYDPLLNTPMDYNSYFLASGNQKFIEYNTDVLIPVRVEAIVYQSETGMPGRKSLAQENQQCRMGITVITSKQSDNASHFIPAQNSGSDPGGCQTITSSNQIIFVDCDNLTEYDRVQEISNTCNPEMKLSFEQKYLKVGNQTTVKATLTIGDLPLGGQLITISSSNSLGISKTSDFTDDNGEVTFEVTGKHKDDQAFIQCNSDVTYYLQEIEVSGAFGAEIQKNWETKNHVTEEGGLKVYSTKIDRWQGTLSHSTGDYCGAYYLDIDYNFTLYWDSLSYQEEKYGSTGGIYGTATVRQSVSSNVCTGETDGISWKEMGGFVPSITVEIRDPFWSDSGEGILHFEAGYLGWWEDHYFDEDKNSWVKEFWETYYDIEPRGGQKISFANHNHIETDIVYKFGHGYSNDVYVEDFSGNNLRSHLVLDRIFSNYEDIGQSDE